MRDPYDPEDAIFGAARYLNASGMPTDTYNAIFSYNHADWYVAEVLANASCYGSLGGGSAGGFALTPQMPVLDCQPAPAWRDRIPADYLAAFEDAAARYELGRRGVWALAAVARLESNFGRGMGAKQLRERGPLGLEPSEWNPYAVDGDEDGHIRRADPADSAATLARLIWSKGSLRAGIFAHNQAAWYVQAVLADAEDLEGKCKTSYVDWRVAPLASGFETPGPSAVLDNGFASAPEDAPAAVKAAISAANSIATTPLHLGRRARLAGTPPGTTARARSASPSTVPGCSTRRSPRVRWRATANRGRGAGSRSTPAPPIPMPRLPGCAGTRSATPRAPAHAGILSLLTRKASSCVTPLGTKTPSRLTERRGSLPRPLRGSSWGGTPDAPWAG